MSWPPKGIWVVEVVGGGGVVGLMRFRGGSISSVTKNKKKMLFSVTGFCSDCYLFAIFSGFIATEKNPHQNTKLFILYLNNNK